MNLSRYKISLLFFLLPFFCYSQTTITGRIINFSDKKPIGFATVFLNNTMVAARTAEDGTYTLINAKSGQYDLIVSFVGFESHRQAITVGTDAIKLPDIELKVKTTQLHEVRIGPPDPRRAEDLAVFMEEFLGTSENAKQCKVLNPDAIYISFDPNRRRLNASTDEFLIVENKALGYRVKYQVDKFVKDYLTHIVYYEGPVLFEEMQGSARQMRNWQKARLNVYKGSDMHFLRTAFTGNMEQEGFKVMKLIRTPNPARPPDTLIKAKLRKFFQGGRAHPEWKDSADAWVKRSALPKVVEYLVAKPMPLDRYVKPTDKPDMLSLQYTDFLYIVYTKKRDEETNSHVYHPLDMPNYPTTVVALTGKYATFDRNGIFTDPSSTTFDGAWGLNKVAELLPVDYTPLPQN